MTLTRPARVTPLMTPTPTSIGRSPERATAPFGVAVSVIMRARHIGVRRLARDAGVSPGYLSRVLRGVEGKRPSPALIRRVAEVLDLPAAFFLEQRRERIVVRIEQDLRLVDVLDDILQGARRERSITVIAEDGDE